MPARFGPASTNRFFRIRSAMTPPMGETANMAIPEPIWARPAEALEPVISKRHARHQHERHHERGGRQHRPRPQHAVVAVFEGRERTAQQGHRRSVRPSTRNTRVGVGLSAHRLLPAVDDRENLGAEQLHRRAGFLVGGCRRSGNAVVYSNGPISSRRCSSLARIWSGVAPGGCLHEHVEEPALAHPAQDFGSLGIGVVALGDREVVAHHLVVLEQAAQGRSPCTRAPWPWPRRRRPCTDRSQRSSAVVPHGRGAP